MALMIKNAKTVLEDQVLKESKIVVDDGIIKEVTTASDEEVKRNFDIKQVCDVQGKHILPGIIDIHSDAIEKAVEPRPEVMFPSHLAVAQLEKNLAAQGITSIFHSFSFSNGAGIRADDCALAMIKEVKEKEQEIVRNLIHVRYEVTNFESYSLVEELLETEQTDLFSLMDHSPGQGQYKSIEDYSYYLQKTYKVDKEDADKVAKGKVERREQVKQKTLTKLVKKALANNISVATHDDDNLEQVDWANELGINIMEFPMDEEVAQRGIDLDMFVSVGAPNIVRGGSHNGNLAAEDLIKGGKANVICSDYYPGSMLSAALKIAQQIEDLPQAIKMITLNPAQAVGKGKQLGSIAAGKLADLLVVDLDNEVPFVEQTFVNGELVFSGDHWN